MTFSLARTMNAYYVRYYCGCAKPCRRLFYRRGDEIELGAIFQEEASGGEISERVVFSEKTHCEVVFFLVKFEMRAAGERTFHSVEVSSRGEALGTP